MDVIQNHKYDEQYLRLHTNAYMLINPAFIFDDGIFSGYNEKSRKYDMTSWQYQLDANGKPMRSADLFAPNTVMSILKKHYSRYSFEVVSSITGASVADIKMAAEIYSSIKPAVFIKVWEGYDRPDVGNLTADPDTPAGQKLLRMVGEGVGRIFAASYKDIENGETRDSFSTPVDGPIPEFYEPVESPTNVVRVFASIGAAAQLPATSLGSTNLSRNRLSKYWGFKGLSTEPSGSKSWAR